jgi:hypothetical protein
MRLKGPLFSLTARKQLGKSIIFKMKNGRAFATGYGKPGSKNKARISTTQIAIRSFYGQQVALWKALTPEEREGYNEQALAGDLKISGWNLFYKIAFDDSIFALKDSIFGKRFYGLFAYGNS